MGVVLDSSVLIAAERGAVDFSRLLDAIGEAPIGIAAITASELLHACHRAPDPGVRARRAAFVEALLDLIPVLPFGLPEARRHAQLWAELSGRGTPIGAHEMQVAATALARGDELATLNAREFARVAGVRLVAMDRFLT